MSFFSNLLSKVKGKKKSDDFDDDDDFDLDEDFSDRDGTGADDDGMEEGEGGVPAPSAMRDDDDFDDDDDVFGEGGSKKSGGSKKKLIIMGSVATVALVAIGGGAYWYFFMGEEVAEEQNHRATASMAIGQPQLGGLTPQQQAAGPAVGGKLVAGAGAKLTAGAKPAAKLSAGGAAPKLSASSAATVSATVGGGMGGFDPKNKENPLSTAAVADVGINIPAVLPRAVADLGPAQTAEPLAPATNESLFETTPLGKLPIVSPEGVEPWKTYARPFDGTPDTPIVGLVVSGLGLSQNLTQAAIDHLPANVTLSFSPYGGGINTWVDKARAMGHEVLLELPMESESFPVDDPGPLSVMTSKGVADNLKVLSQLMAQAQGYTGFVGQHGSAFTKNKKAMLPILGELKTRGLFFMDPRSSDQTLTLELADQLQLPRAIADNTVKVNVSQAQIRAQLETLATIAGTKKVTAAIVPATPASIKMIIEWAKQLQTVRIAPMSSLAGRQQS